MSNPLQHAADAVAAIKADGFAFGYGAGRSTLRSMVAKSKCPLTEAQWAIVDEITDFAHSRCVAWAPVVVDAIETNPTEYHQVRTRFSDRIHDGLSYTDHIVPLCILNDQQAWYWWSRNVSGHVPTDRQFFKTRDCYPETWCQLIDITPEQKEQCREFYESSEIIHRPRRSRPGTRSIRKYAVDKVGACERILTDEQRDNWNRIKTAGTLRSDWTLRSDRPVPDPPADQTPITPDRRRLADLSSFFSLLARRRAEVAVTPIQTQFLSRLEAIIQKAHAWAQLRGHCPLTVRREEPRNWAVRELIRYSEQTAKLLILTEEQEQILNEVDRP